MSYFYRTLCLLGFICCFGFLAGAQSPSLPLLSAEFKGADFESFIKELENKSGYRFYYDSAQIDSLSITATYEQEGLSSVLQKSLQNSGLEFSIDQQAKHVFITREQRIITELPQGFFSVEKPEQKDEFVVDYFQGQGQRTWVKKDKLYEIGRKTLTIVPGTAKLVGQIRNNQTGELVVGASVYIEKPFTGASTDAFGNYAINLPRGRHVLKIRSLGMLNEELQLVMYSDGKLDIELEENIEHLKAVEISAERDQNVAQAQMGIDKMDIKAIRKVPSVMGEPDVLRAVVALPGVKTVGEASTGFNVRGGSVDQNLILFNDAVIYNPSHLFGFFSAFNADVMDGVELYKSSIPAQYGGRLSSVLKVTPRYGNKKKFQGNAGIGLLTSRLTLEGPIGEKTSFIVGGRTTYSNWVLGLLNNKEFKNSRASFYDVNLNLDHELNEKNNLYLTAYFSKDKFKLKSDTTWGYENANMTLKWKSIISNRLISEYSVNYSRYKYGVEGQGNPVNDYKLSFGIHQATALAGFVHTLNSAHTLSYGLSSSYYKLNPGSEVPAGQGSAVAPNVLENEQALESALYLEDQFDISKQLNLTVGLRYSLYNYLGPKDVISYANGIPRNEDSMVDTISHASGAFIKTYHGPEYRLALRYLLTPTFSVKASYNTLRQYIHMISNTTAISPTDIWKLSDPNIRPQFGEQFSLGFYKNMRGGIIETSLEGYYKNISDYLDYKGGAELIMNPHIETEVINTEGKAYGAELMVKKLSGKVNGWISYTYSRTLLRMDDPNAGELINRGDWYAANHDKPHDFNLNGNYKFSHRFSVSLTCAYSTGRPITLPIGKYWYAGAERTLYADRNSSRIPDYFRTDLAMNIEGNHKLKQLTHNSWTIGVYNLLARRNAYSIYFVTENGKINGYKLSIFGTAIPFINYNIRF